jgi:hypothetical protein
LLAGKRIRRSNQFYDLSISATTPLSSPIGSPIGEFSLLILANILMLTAKIIGKEQICGTLLQIAMGIANKMGGSANILKMYAKKAMGIENL